MQSGKAEDSLLKKNGKNQGEEKLVDFIHGEMILLKILKNL